MRKMICIICPKGCHLEIDDNHIVTGNSCKRGEVYAISEVTNPTRMVTSTVKVKNGIIKRVPVVTSNPVPKNKIFEVMHEINNITVDAPIKINDIIIKNILDLGLDIKATRNVEKEKILATKKI